MEAIPDDVPVADEDEQAALRVQAAAVAAQQMALALDEERLRQRSAALERQEAQLATHLEERRARLLELQEQVRQDRDSLKSERAAAETERELLRQDLAKERDEAIAAGERARNERTRLAALRRRLRERARRHWKEREAEQVRSEKQLAEERGRLAEEAKAIARERDRWLQTQLRVSSDIELGHRRVQEARDDLSLSQQEWDACLNSENALRERREAELAAREAAVSAAERSLAADRERWLRQKADLSREVEGLETRVANHRASLASGPPARDAGWLAPRTQPPPRLLPVSEAAVPELLATLAGDLADQRLHLLEQWGRLLAVQSSWEEERAALLADFEAIATRLDERERFLRSREARADEHESAVHRLRAEADRERSIVEGLRVRLDARAATLTADRLALVTELRVREESVAREADRLRRQRARSGERRRQELAALRELRARYGESRDWYLQATQECEDRRAELNRARRDVAAKLLAVERLRQEVLARAPDASAAERRMAKLEAREVARIAAAEQQLVAVQAMVQQEIERLSAEWQTLDRHDAELHRRQEEQESSREERDQAQADAEAHQNARQDELRRLQVQHDRDRAELAALRDEVERVARYLIGDDAADSAADRQAA